MKNKREKKERIIQSLLFYASNDTIGAIDIKDGTMESTDTIDFILHSQVPHDKKVTCASFACDRLLPCTFMST